MPARQPEPVITLGYTGWGFLPALGIYPFKRLYQLKGKQRTKHKKVMGITGMGKSYLLAQMTTELILQGIGTTLIDPHGDLAHDTLQLLLDAGFFTKPNAYQRLLYLDFGREDRFVPFNILNQNFGEHTIARNIVDACTRAYPELAISAPLFYQIMNASVVVLRANALPLTAMQELLTDQAYREQLLRQPRIDEVVLRYFKNEFDNYGRDMAANIGSTLRRVFDLTFHPSQRFSLGQMANVLNTRSIVDGNISVIINLSGLDAITQKLLGCLIMVCYEQAALARYDLPPQKRNEYHLIIDEAFSFSTREGESMARLLSQARKFNFCLTFAHQTWGQQPPSVQEAVQNMGIDINFGLGAMDAQLVASRISQYTDEVKHTVEDETQVERTHPLFRTIQEQEKQLADKLHNLWEQDFIVSFRNRAPRPLQLWWTPWRVVKLRTLTTPKPQCSDEAVQAVKDYYARRFMRTRGEIERGLQQHPPLKQRPTRILQEGEDN